MHIIYGQLHCNTFHNEQVFFSFSIYLPELNHEGSVCVHLNYNMYGFHINTLKLMTETEDGTQEVMWYKSKEQGSAKQWFEANVEVEMKASDKEC